MKISELRKEFLNYFSARDHKIMASSSLLPAGDQRYYSSVEWYHLRLFFREEVPPHPRLASVQSVCAQQT